MNYNYSPLFSSKYLKVYLYERVVEELFIFMIAAIKPATFYSAILNSRDVNTHISISVII